MGKITFDNSNSIFFQSLKKSVELYFKERGLKKNRQLAVIYKNDRPYPGSACHLYFPSFYFNARRFP